MALRRVVVVGPAVVLDATDVVAVVVVAAVADGELRAREPALSERQKKQKQLATVCFRQKFGKMMIHNRTSTIIFT